MKQTRTKLTRVLDADISGSKLHKNAGAPTKNHYALIFE